MKAIQHFPDDKHLAMGDFNLHHSSWGGTDIGQNDKGASILLEWMLEKILEQVLPPETVIYSERGGKNTIDLVFGSEGLRENMVFCDISQDYDYDSDHMPILSEWKLQVQEKSEDSRLQFKKTNFCKLCDSLTQGLYHSLQTPALHNDELDDQVELLVLMRQ